MSAGPRHLLAPRLWGLHALAVVATTAAVLLGIWQYDAWGSRREDQAASRANAPARPLSSVMSPDDPFPGDAVGQPVALSGRWLPRSTVYVADRELDGRRGMWVVTPVEVCAAGADCTKAPAMLVVRGWARSVRDAPRRPRGGWTSPAGCSRARAPASPTRTRPTT